MQDIWDRITSWLSIHAPEILNSFQPGATEDEIRAVEEKLWITFPADIRLSFHIYNEKWVLNSMNKTLYIVSNFDRPSPEFSH
jgi:cell wall assembly regulator SMI1